jgi:hypothetical protein
VERLAAERGVILGQSDLQTLDGLWDEVKRDELNSRDEQQP